MCMSAHVPSHIHGYTQKQHASPQDECKRFIFRPLGPLLCSGFIERMREPPCPLGSIYVGGGAFIVAPGRALVSECRSAQRWSPTEVLMVAWISISSADKHWLTMLISLIPRSKRADDHFAAFHSVYSSILYFVLISTRATCSVHVAQLTHLPTSSAKPSFLRQLQWAA